MKTMWDPPCQREIRDRVARLLPERKGEWGRMSAPEMVCHLAESLKMALGDLPVTRKNVPTAPELVARPPRAWNADVADVQVLIDRFVARGGEATPWPEHPAGIPRSCSDSPR